jgi:CubicO group peptidase (beta-lactamase class C family)
VAIRDEKRAMRIFPLCMGLAWAFGATGQLARAELRPESPADLASLLAGPLKTSGIPGMAALVLRDGRVVAQGSGGVQRRDGPVISSGDVFALCSATKAMTATLVAISIERGELSLASTLGEVFPAGELAMHSGWREVNVAQLLDHRAGLPGDSEHLWRSLRISQSDQSLDAKVTELLTRTLHDAPRHRPGSEYRYTGIDYILLGRMLERVSEKPWSELLRTRLFEPLAITTPPQAQAAQPWGHWNTALSHRAVKPDSFFARINPPDFYQAAAGVRLPLAEWSRFIELHLRGDPTNPHHEAQLLRSESFATLHQPAPGNFYRAGWTVKRTDWARGTRDGDQGLLLISEGDNGFWHVDAWLAPEIDVAILIAINQGKATDKTRAAFGVRDAYDALTRAYAVAR